MKNKNFKEIKLSELFEKKIVSSCMYQAFLKYKVDECAEDNDITIGMIIDSFTTEEINQLMETASQVAEFSHLMSEFNYIVNLDGYYEKNPFSFDNNITLLYANGEISTCLYNTLKEGMNGLREYARWDSIPFTLESFIDQYSFSEMKTNIFNFESKIVDEFIDLCQRYEYILVDDNFISNNSAENTYEFYTSNNIMALVEQAEYASDDTTIDMMQERCSELIEALSTYKRLHNSVKDGRYDADLAAILIKDIIEVIANIKIATDMLFYYFPIEESDLKQCLDAYLEKNMARNMVRVNNVDIQ